MPDDDWALGQNEVDVRNEARIFACRNPEAAWIADQRRIAEHLIHLASAGQPLGRTACGLEIETPDRPWEPGLVPDAQWMGPFGEITCSDCLDSVSQGRGD